MTAVSESKPVSKVMIRETRSLSITAAWSASRAERRRWPRQDDFRPFSVCERDREDLFDRTQDRVEGGLDGIPAIEGDIPVEDFLENLGISDQSLAGAEGRFQQLTRPCLVRMGGTDQVHRNIRVDEDQPGSIVR